MERDTRIIRTLNRCREWCAECKVFNRAFAAALLLGVGGGLLYAFVLSPPSSFKTPAMLVVESGTPLRSIADTLERKEMIRSSFLFTAGVVLVRGEKGAVAGNYFFAHPQNVFTIAARIAFGRHELTPVKVTLPEGSTVEEMAQILGERLGSFDTERFLLLVAGKEGYLFPDTYYFLPGETPETVAAALQENFFRTIATLETEIVEFGKPLAEVVIMASLLEEEARTQRSRQIIAGILWKRVERGMRLQVDAVFPYIMGKNTFQVTRADLAVESPYNTYLHEGLPIGPISNPGVESLKAAVTPLETPYLYYLSDKKGRFHWGRTYDEHVRNKELYLGS